VHVPSDKPFLVMYVVAAQVNPDAEFGCMSAFYGPLGSSWAESALLRVDMGEHQADSLAAGLRQA
jgi:hypothetical protein